MIKSDCRSNRKVFSKVGRQTVMASSCLATAGMASLLLLGMAGKADAFTLYDGSQYGNNLEVNLTTAFGYTGILRVNSPSAVLTGPANANGSEGDIDQPHGIVGNEFEATPTLDIRDGNYGAHFSADGYINTPYLNGNDNNQPGTFNPLSTTNNQSYTTATRNVEGLDAHWLDGFVYGKEQIGDNQTIQLKVGRQTLTWGQALFFPNNGLAGAMAPVDVITAQNLANPQTQQILYPVGQAVLTYNIGTYTFQGFYQFQYEHDLLQGVGGYFSSSDLFDAGGQRLIAGPGLYATRRADNTPPTQNGRFGLSAQTAFGNYDVGLYGLRYDSYTPEIYLYPGVDVGQPTPGGIILGQYQLVYPRDIWMVGTSLSTTVGPANVAGEITTKFHEPLDTGLGIVDPGTSPDTNGNPLYPVGTTLQAQSSVIYVAPGLPLMPGGFTVDGEVAYNHLITVTQNREALATGRQGSAAAFDVEITPTYYDVLPSLEVDFPVSVTYDFLGNSATDPTFNHGVGAFTTGITGTYEGQWVASLVYKDYFGKANTTTNALADRGYVALSLSKSF
jgi:hypothetical protein